VSVVEKARDFALDAYGSESELEHPADVARLVAAAGGSEELQAAAYLHDLIEDTDLEVGAIAAEFGSQIASYVAAMTEDESISEYLEQKDDARRRARDAGREVALLFVADKLSNARRMRRGSKRPRARKLAHYATTLAMMREAYPDLPLLDELDAELSAVRAELQRSPA
jgi:(p)ppGpp synthase/HD superfamily hydrolase